MSEIVSELTIGRAARLINSGHKIAVICKSKPDAFERAGKFAARYRRDTRVSVEGAIVKVDGFGVVEFAWLETQSGRRLDDFDVATGKIFDPWDNRAPEGKPNASTVEAWPHSAY